MKLSRFFKYSFFYIIVLLNNLNCRGQISKEQQQERIRVLIPFVPGNCHLCNEQFYDKLKVLDIRKIPYAFLLSEDFSEDIDYIKKEYKLENFKSSQFILNSSLFEKYHIALQEYVLEFGIDSSYKIYNNIEVLIKDLISIKDRDTFNLGNYKIKKSTSIILADNKEQIYIQNWVQTNTFDYIDLVNKKQQLKISFTPQHLFNNYLLNFKDSLTAKSKLKEVEAADISKRDEFIHFEYVHDSLYATSMHTYIRSMKDSVLRSFYTLNIYKNGVYCGSHEISNAGLPEDYYIIPRFHIYNNTAYFSVVKLNLDKDKPNYFLAKFELENGVYRFKGFLKFTVPSIHKEVGYKYVDLKFSGKYCMTSIANILYDLETEQYTSLSIPVNERFGFDHIMNNSKGVNILVKNINVEYPNLLITYFSKDENGKSKNIILKYNIEHRNIEGKIQFPESNSRFMHPDCTRFGYFLWVPEKDNDYLVYKKMF
ncbi:hypothetical protein D3C86_985440 [compost metagenome]